MSGVDVSSLPASSVLAFAEALSGPPGALDGWLECNNEAEVRAHVLAYTHTAVAELIAAIRAMRFDAYEATTPEMIAFFGMRKVVVVQDFAMLERVQAALSGKQGGSDKA